MNEIDEIEWMKIKKYYNSMDNTDHTKRRQTKINEKFIFDWLSRLICIIAAAQPTKSTPFHCSLRMGNEIVSWLMVGGLGGTKRMNERSKSGLAGLTLGGLVAAQPHGNQPKEKTSSPLELSGFTSRGSTLSAIQLTQLIQLNFFNY